MKNVKRVLCLFIGLVMLVTVFTGCGGTKKPTDTQASNRQNTPAKAEKLPWEKAPKVVSAVPNSYDVMLGKTGDDIMDNPYTRYIYEKTGVRLETLLLPSGTNEFVQALAVKVASGEQIDLISFGTLGQSWMDNGTVIRIDDILEKNKTIIPNILKNIPDDAWIPASKLDVKTGKTVKYGIPVRNLLGKPSMSALWLRQDWMDKLKLSMPKTTDELTNVFKAFTENDPDGNGKKDTFGIGTGKGFTNTSTLMQLWGVASWYEIQVGDKLIPAGHSDQARAALKTIRTWYKNGYLDIEGVTDGNANKTKILNGKIGCCMGSLDTIATYWDQMVATGQKDAKWAMIGNPIISSFDNKPYYFRKADNTGSITQFCAAGKESNYQNVLRMLDWMYSEEGTTFLSWGLEGREYKVENGKKVRDTQYIKVDQKSYLNAFGLGKSYNTVFPEIFLEGYNTANSRELAQRYFDINAKMADQLCWPVLDIKFQYPDLPTLKQYPDYMTAISAYIGKFALGEVDINDDKAWADYIKESEKYGFQKILDEAWPLWKARK